MRNKNKYFIFFTRPFTKKIYLLIFILFHFTYINCNPASVVNNFTQTNKKKLNVILITADTLRGDFLSTNGYPHPITPNLDKFAAKSFNFTKAYSTGSRTNISVGSIHKGLYTSNLDFSFYPYVNLKISPNYKVNKKYPPLYTNVIDKDTHLSLADILHHEKYSTHAFIDGGGYAYFEKGQGYLKGFKSIYNVAKKDLYSGSVLVRKKFRQFINSRVNNNDNKKVKKKKQAFFAWIHFMETHSPYRNSKKGKKYSGGRIGRYEGAVNFLDKELGKLFSYLEKQGLMENSIVIFSSDHGEGLGQHGSLYHVDNIFEEQVRVPLIIYTPLKAKGTFTNPVSIVDIVPTVLSFLGIDYKNIQDENKQPYSLDGKALNFLLEKLSDKTIIKANKKHKNRIIYLDTFDSWKRRPEPTTHTKGLIYLNYKYIKNISTGKEYFFNLRTDPKERKNLLKNKLKFKNTNPLDYENYLLLKNTLYSS